MPSNVNVKSGQKPRLELCAAALCLQAAQAELDMLLTKGNVDLLHNRLDS